MDPRARAFVELDTWFADLPASQQNEWLAYRDEIASATTKTRLLPGLHGSDIQTQLWTARREFELLRDPFLLVRVSDSELGFLGAGLLPPSAPQPIEWYAYRGGFGPDALPHRPAYIEAIRNATMVGLQQNWEPITRASSVLLRMLGFEPPLANGVEVHVNYDLLVTGRLFGHLAGKRVVFVGWLGPRLADVWRDQRFRAGYRRFGPMDRIDVVGAVPMPSRDEGGAFTGYDAARTALETIDFDVALLACGVAAKPLAWDIYGMGKTALDVGFVFNALLGDDERTKRPVLREVDWPDGWWMP